MTNVFYSWQSDLPGNTNRNFIEDAIKKALRDLAKDEDVYQPPREVDRDTRGVAGSPNIAETIFAKIDAASACVFDVSIVLRGDKRASPNPNVLVELGYALKAHRDARVIMVLSVQTGEPEELPFDLRFRRVLPYNPVEVGGDRSKAKQELVGDLVAALKATFAHNEANRFTRDEVEFFTVLYNNVRHSLNLRVELDDRSLGSDFEMLRSDCANTAENLRELATLDIASDRQDVAGQLARLCGALDKLKTWRPAMGAGHFQKFVALMDAAQAEAMPLLEAATDAVRQGLSGRDFGPLKRQHARRALQEFERFRTDVEQRNADHLREIRRALQSTGVAILRLAAELEVIGDADAQVFRPAGHALNVADIEKSQEIGYREEQELIARLKPLLEPLERFTKADS